MFLSWQEGLEDERDVFFEVITRYNYDEAVRRGIMFIPTDWKSVPKGYGRAQSRINEKLSECDYMLIVFWCRWGTPPEGSGDRGFTSGTEEEYAEAVESLNGEDKPMRGVVCYFKEIPNGQLADAGPQLEKLLEFKEKVRTEGLLGEFKDLDGFRDLLRKQLADWLYDIEGIMRPKMPETTVLDRFEEP